MIRRDIHWKILPLATIIYCSLAFAVPVTATIVSYNEDFTTTDYRDAVATTAWWDTALGQLRLFNVEIALIATYPTTGSTFDTTVNGNHAYLADGDGGLVSVNITDPEFPVTGDSELCLGRAHDLVIDGNYAYLAVYQSGESKVQVFDISSPTALASVGWCEIPGYPHGIDHQGTYVFVAQSAGGIQSVRISNPDEPVLGDAVTTYDWAEDLVIDGTYAYVADGGSGLTIVDISDPEAMSLVGTVDPGGYALGVAVSGQYAYLACSTHGFFTIDISTPATPVVLGSCSIPGNATSVVVEGQFAYVTASAEGLQIVDITDPSDPLPASGLDTTGDAKRLCKVDNYVYLADGSAGLQIIDVDPAGLNTADNMAQSILLIDGEDPISRARISAATTDSIKWELSVDDGSVWQEIAPDNAWFTFPVEGYSLKWRATLVYTDVPEGPTCSSLDIEYEVLQNSASISAVEDIPNDQGRQVRVGWDASRFDGPGEPTQITEYSVYRRIDPELAGPALPAHDAPPLFYPPGDWDFLVTVPADAEESYAVVVPTLADSTINDGQYWSVFFVRARTAVIGTYYDSAPDSGYSVDNLEPAVPLGFAVAYHSGGNQLAWDPAPEIDFYHFRIYRGLFPDFDLLPENLLATTTDSDYFDETATEYFYKLTCLDFSGNESQPALASPTGVPANTRPLHSFLYQNHPNPFNPRTVLAYAVGPGGGQVRLEIFDLRGRLVSTLVDAHHPAGHHEIIWNGTDTQGRPVATGVYYCRFSAPDFQLTRKMTLAR